MRSSGLLFGALAALFLSVPRPSHAAFYVETTDAGALPAAATSLLTFPSLTGISGNLSSTTDRDMFAIYLTGGGTFSATTVGQPGTLLDSQLFLFDSTGRGVYGNDDDASGQGSNQFRSTLPANSARTPLSAGIYYLLIVASGANPTGNGGLIFPNYITPPTVDPTAVVGPTGPGGGSPITGYTGTASESGTYSIALTGVGSIPEPSSILLVGTAIALVAGGRTLLRRRAA